MSDLSGKYKVFLGGRDRGLRYTVDDAEQLETMFRRDDGLPVGVFALAQDILNIYGSRTVFHAVLHIGLKRVDSRITPEKVKQWFQEVVEKDDREALREVRIATYNALGDSGIAGFKWPEADLSDPDLADEEGPKAQPES